MSPAPRFLFRWIAWMGVLLLGILLIERHLASTWVVVGDSMEPTLVQGDRVLVDRWSCSRRSPRVGEVILVRTDDGAIVVKRVARAPRHAPGGLTRPSVWVLGDNPGASRDSRHFGAVPIDRVAGRLAWRYWPVSRFGPLPVGPSDKSGVASPARR